jgi:hypothetical protein
LNAIEIEAALAAAIDDEDRAWIAAALGVGATTEPKPERLGPLALAADFAAEVCAPSRYVERPAGPVRDLVGELVEAFAREYSAWLGLCPRLLAGAGEELFMRADRREPGDLFDLAVAAITLGTGLARLHARTEAVMQRPTLGALRRTAAKALAA